MKKTTLKATLQCVLLGLAFFISCLPLKAQMHEVQEEKPNKIVLEQIGATFGIGVVRYDLQELNASLQELGIGQFDNELVPLHFSIYTGFKGNFNVSFDLNWASSFGSKEMQDTRAEMNLSTFSYGPTLYYSVLTTNRFRLMALAGLRKNDMTLQYNADALASPDFVDLLTNPAAGDPVIVMKTARSAESVTFGSRLQYRLGRKENLKAREYSLGIDLGYNHSFESVPWSEPLSRNTIRNMPAIKSDHFYLHFTFSTLLLRP